MADRMAVTERVGDGTELTSLIFVVKFRSTLQPYFCRSGLNSYFSMACKTMLTPPSLAIMQQLLLCLARGCKQAQAHNCGSEFSGCCHMVTKTVAIPPMDTIAS